MVTTRKPKQTRKSFGFTGMRQADPELQAKEKLLNPLVVQSLSFLLKMNKKNVINQIKCGDSVQRRIAFGLSREDPVISVYASAIFESQSIYLRILKQLAQDGVPLYVPL